MTDSEQRALVLIGSSQEWSARSLESVFSRDEYEVRRYESGRDVIAHAQGADLVVLDQNLKGIDALAVCRALSENERIGPTTPIVMVTASATIDRAERVLALDAGAWDVISLAVDGDMLVLRLRNFLLAKRESDRVRSATLVDTRTGLYNRQGFEMRGREMSGEARRAHAMLACVALSIEVLAAGPRANPHVPQAEQRAEYLARLLRSGRVSDVAGRIHDDEFGLLLPSTSEEGILRVLDRLQATMAAAPPLWTSEGRTTRLCAGYDLVSGDSDQDVTALIDRASKALHRRREGPDDVPIKRYDA